MKEMSAVHRLPIRRGSVEYCTAGEADHESIYQTLLHVFHGPDRDTFLGALSDPDYRPDQRLIVKVDGKLVSHVHLTERQIRYGQAFLKMNGVLWVGTLPEYRGLGFAQNLIRLANQRSRETGAVIQALSTGMPQFYRPLGWGVCGNATVGLTLSRSVPAGVVSALPDARGGAWTVRPWRQVELGDLMRLYDAQYKQINGTVVRSEQHWRWLIGRRYAHVIWVACQGEAVHGYAFVKDHRVLELAFNSERPQALLELLGRVRAEALERAYPEVEIHAPTAHPAILALKEASGRVTDLEELEGVTSMYHIPDAGRFLNAILPALEARVAGAQAALPFEMGLSVDDRKWLLHIAPGQSRVDPDKLGRRYLSLSQRAFARLAMGETGIDQGTELDGIEPSTQTAIDAARVLFPTQPLWRSPLDAGTA